jgi:hypothetical protein
MAKRPGKYAHVIDRLRPLGIEPERRDLVESVKQEILNATPLDAQRVPLRELLSEMTTRVRHIIDIEKRSTAGKPYAAEYARAYAELRAVKDIVGEWESSVNLLIEAFMWMMTEQMEVEGTTALTLANGQPIHTFLEPTAKVDDPEVFRQWCMAPVDICMTCGRDNEYPNSYVHEPNDDGTFPDGKHAFKPGGGMINKMALAWASTNALTKEMLLAGEPAPPGISTWAKTVVRLGKGDE